MSVCTLIVEEEVDFCRNFRNFSQTFSLRLDYTFSYINSGELKMKLSNSIQFCKWYKFVLGFGEISAKVNRTDETADTYLDVLHSLIQLKTKFSDTHSSLSPDSA